MTTKRIYTKPPRDGCSFKRSSGLQEDGVDGDCDYNPDFECDDCMYCQGRPKGTGKNPQAKSNQRGDYK